MDVRIAACNVSVTPFAAEIVPAAARICACDALVFPSARSVLAMLSLLRCSLTSQLCFEPGAPPPLLQPAPVQLPLLLPVLAQLPLPLLPPVLELLLLPVLAQSPLLVPALRLLVPLLLGLEFE
ncbi:hypothetical protein G7009_10390 [Pseudomonas capeferrum]|nr:hypothetical protein [Pseudomonas capeferrum]MBA1202163.1 hypothetical protein [Pseudomonas capeferrum]